MNQQDKKLLLKDLCNRLPYGVMVKTPYNNAELIGINGIVRRKGYTKGSEYIDVITDKQTYPIRYVTPYLRPMSSMTEEEIDTMWDISENNAGAEGSSKITDLLNKWNLDHHHLIEKGLAIEAPEGMYK